MFLWGLLGALYSALPAFVLWLSRGGPPTIEGLCSAVFLSVVIWLLVGGLIESFRRRGPRLGFGIWVAGLGATVGVGFLIALSGP